jgi:hypothetical protein
VIEPVDGRRVALLVATDRYQDTGLSKLAAPATDVKRLAAALRHPDVAGFHVTPLYNKPHHVVGKAIGNFYQDRRHDDLTLLYFSGHGVKDDYGRLYLTMTDTERDNLQFTGLQGEQIRTAMEGCRSRQNVLILDCCYAGAFPADRSVKGDTAIHTMEKLGGRGCVVLTSSDATQYSFEGNQLTETGSPSSRAAQGSLFTRFLIEGLMTGRADLDDDGDITLDELYDYVHDHVIAEQPQQRPKKKDDVEGRITIAQNIHWTLPAHISDAVNGPYAPSKLAALEDLSHRHRNSNAIVQQRVLDMVRKLAGDDSKQVSTAAHQFLLSLTQEKERPRPEEQAEQEAERQAQQEAQEEAERKAQQEAQEEAERQAQQAAERQAREEAERKALEEAERQAQEAERQAREEAERQAQQAAERKARQEAERKARQEAERKARQEAERKARQKAERKARQKAERKARQKAERKAQEEAERRAQQQVPKAPEDTVWPVLPDLFDEAHEAHNRQAEEQTIEVGSRFWDRAKGLFISSAKSRLRALAEQKGLMATPVLSGGGVLSALAGLLHADEALVNLSNPWVQRLPGKLEPISAAMPIKADMEWRPNKGWGLLVVTDRRLLFAIRPLHQEERLGQVSTFEMPYLMIDMVTRSKGATYESVVLALKTGDTIELQYYGTGAAQYANENFNDIRARIVNLTDG